MERAAIQRRVMNFKAHQDRFQRERAEYYATTMAKARATQWNTAGNPNRSHGTRSHSEASDEFQGASRPISTRARRVLRDDHGKGARHAMEHGGQSKQIAWNAQPFRGE